MPYVHHETRKEDNFGFKNGEKVNEIITMKLEYRICIFWMMDEDNSTNHSFCPLKFLNKSQIYLFDRFQFT